MTDFDFDWLATGLRNRTADFAAAAQQGDPAATVPTCPDWQLRNLVGHIGQGQRWAAEIVRTGTIGGPPDPLDAEPGSPEQWTQWVLAASEELIAAVQQHGPQDPAVSILGSRPAAFWVRRMMHDVSIHCFDAARTAAIPYEIPADYAADGIAELLELFTDPQVRVVRPDLAALNGSGETIGLRPLSGDGWLITRTADGPVYERKDGPADVTLAGSPGDLLLALAQRLPLDDDSLTCTGDREVLEQWLARTGL
ncbi:maleylpyruvate isomerase family mycothiol-dependent enzyme [Nocardia panacis]|uniref:Maleylpyruvate isomerase family mycothiol-dependent enzyme n=1 Tax=Nocardia panacis TaxID=2340916 RepID=A0A3A4JYJ6_9NOCA|nr:maleylpyruvate isomerase family mycothiol-dependent enzyme [Nocardia panacis]RJO72273.1 maleylpyruvate isomerase family mycothiol-dependent enzyme [Nocardia panacis]